MVRLLIDCWCLTLNPNPNPIVDSTYPLQNTHTHIHIIQTHIYLNLNSGLVRAMLNSVQHPDLNVNNNPIDHMEAGIKVLYKQDSTPLFLVRAVLADVECLKDNVTKSFKTGNRASIGALQVKKIRGNMCKFCIPPILVSSGWLRFPDVHDPGSVRKMQEAMQGFVNPTWRGFERIAVAAPALRLAALSYNRNQLWPNLERPPLQMVFSSPSTNKAAHQLLSEISIRNNLTVHWYDGGENEDLQFDKIHELVLKNKIVVITMDRTHLSRFDAYLAIPATSTRNKKLDVLIVAIESKFSSDAEGSYLSLKDDCEGKINSIDAQTAWIPKNLPRLLVFATNRRISEDMGTKLQAKCADLPVILSNNLAKMFSSDLVPPRYRHE